MEALSTHHQASTSTLVDQRVQWFQQLLSEENELSMGEKTHTKVLSSFGLLVLPTRNSSPQEAWDRVFSGSCVVPFGWVFVCLLSGVSSIRFPISLITDCCQV